MKKAALLAAVFVIKLIVVFQLRHHPLLQADSGLDTSAYIDLASRVIAGQWGLGPGLYYVSPLYIYFLAIGYGVTKSFTAVRLAQAVLGTVSVGLIFLTAREWFGSRAAWIAAVLAGLTGLVTFYEALILQASLDPVLTAAALWLLTLALTRQRPVWYALAGLAFGVQSLNRPNVLLAAAGIVVLLALLRRLRPAVLVAIGLLAGLAPVAIRNAVVSHQFSLVSSHGGLNFYVGNGEGATGYFHEVPGVSPTIEGQERDSKRVAEQALGRALTDAEVSTYFSDLAWTWIGRHPLDWAGLLVRKLGGVFHAQHTALPFSYPFYAYDAGTILQFCVVGPWLLVPLGLVGLVAAAPVERRREYLVWASFVPAYAAAVAIFFISERYRLPLFVPLTIAAGAGADMVLRAVTARQSRTLALTGGALVILAVAANWPIRLDDGRAEERIRMAERMARAGKVDEAERWASLALTTYAYPKFVHYRVGAQFVNSGQWQPALDHLTQALQLDPGAPRLELAVGKALAGLGRWPDALPHLQRAVDGKVDMDLAGYDLAMAMKETGDPAGAARVLASVEPAAGDNVEVWLRLGRLAAEIRAPDVAERFFQHAAVMAPDLAAARVQFGLNQLVLRKYESAARELAAAASLDPRDADALAYLASCEVQLGRLADARAHVAAALAINPAHELARQLQTIVKEP